MQRPTLRDVRIRSTRDTLLVFNAVARNVLPLITRRLDAEERRAIVPGNVYVWEERGANTESTEIGMERWTDGMGWGPSRVRDVSFALPYSRPGFSLADHVPITQEFLFYHQKEFELNGDPSTASTPWAQMISVYPASHSRLTSDVERLIKQTYSVHVSLPADRPRGITRKWHLTAYFSQQKLDGLTTLDTIQGVGDVEIPEGWFKSARAGKSRRDNCSASDSSHVNTSANINGTGNNARDVTHSNDKNRAGANTDVILLASPSGVTTRSPLSQHAHAQQQQPQQQLHHHCRLHDPPRRHSPQPSSPSSSASSPHRSSHDLAASQNIPTLGTSRQLVPLQYLRNISVPRRDPTDEQLLRRLTVHSRSSSSVATLSSVYQLT